MHDGLIERRVTRYLWIDHCAEGCGYVEPKDGETFICYPFSYFEDSSQPFIAVKVDDETVRTINACDLAEIEFAESEVDTGGGN